MAGGTVRSSLFAATDEAGIPDAVATQLAEIFANDIDFRRELERGASFSVVYEALSADGEPITWGPLTGRVLAAEFVNKGQTFSAMWFKDGEAKGGYFGLDGQSKQRSFLANPLEFSRVTSGFSMRMHPILNSWKQAQRRRLRRPGRHAGPDDRRRRRRVRRLAERLRQRRPRSPQQRALDGVRALEPTRRRQGPEGRHRHDHRRGRPDWLGDRSASPLRGQDRRACSSDPLQVAQTSEAVVVAPASKSRFGQLVQSVRAQLGVAETLPRTPLLGE